MSRNILMLSAFTLVRRVISYAHHLAIRAFFIFLEYVVPVRDDFWCFCTWQDYSHTIDNPRAVFEAVKDDASICKIVLQKSTSPPPVPEGERIRFIEAESFSGAYHLARSRVILLGYALQGMSTYSRHLRDSRHAVIQLWHGVALKRIGRLVPREHIWKEESPRYTATLASSEPDRQVMRKAFAPISESRVWLTGLPRNDVILKTEKELPSDYRRHLREITDRLKGRKFILYAPTWREEEDALYDFSNDERDELERVLDKHGAVLGIRGHVKVRRHEAYRNRRQASAIIGVNDFPDVNVVLRRTDVLITDYSSLYIDYLLMDRPIIHFAYDLAGYASERGFVHDPEQAFGGPCARTFNELLEYLDKSLSDLSSYRPQRQSARQLFHDHPYDSGDAVCRRIRSLVGGLKQRRSRLRD